ncbi:MAG: methylenetetrahydrofolate reductase [Clostridia bacterium]|nr:methylenetetrahydrofolate reductase [Clostridia bacterium]
MKISDIYSKKGNRSVSFEIFPPKGDLDVATVKGLVGDLASLGPDYISVTYSAGGGGNSKNTLAVTSAVKEAGVESMAHLTCINSSREEIYDLMGQLKARGIENVFALRGDIAENGALSKDFSYASDLIPVLKENGFCVGAACYPEGHVQCESVEKDIYFLKKKQDAGADFFLSQLFFDNERFFRFLESAQKAGITVPISAGIMPLLGKSQISRMIFMCGASLPSDIIRILNRYENSPDDLRRAGIEYAARQISEILDHGGASVHLYTMNHPDIAGSILSYIRDLGYEL